MAQTFFFNFRTDVKQQVARYSLHDSCCRKLFEQCKTNYFFAQRKKVSIFIIIKGGYAGNAAGMKISSLHKLTDIRSNRPGKKQFYL